MGNCAGSKPQKSIKNPKEANLQGLDKPQDIQSNVDPLQPPPQQTSAIQNPESIQQGLDKPQDIQSHVDPLQPPPQQTSAIQNPESIQQGLDQPQDIQSHVDPLQPPPQQTSAIQNPESIQQGLDQPHNIQSHVQPRSQQTSAIQDNPSINGNHVVAEIQNIGNSGNDYGLVIQYPSLIGDEKGINLEKSGFDTNKIEVKVENDSELKKSNQNAHKFPIKFDQLSPADFQKDQPSSIHVSTSRSILKDSEQIYEESYRQYGQTTVNHPDRIQVAFII